MELSGVFQFLQSSTILVTGATGFLAKIFVEKILRVQPNVKKLYLLLRAEDADSASQRLYNEVIAKELFGVLREKMGGNLNSLVSQKAIPIPGDVACENLGVNDPRLLELLWREVNVVVHLAATTKFDERYDVALSINTFGAKHALDFAKKCANMKLLLYVSTAYVSGEREGAILEKPYNMGETLNGTSGLDVYEEKRVIEERLEELRVNEATQKTITTEMKALGIQRARKYGWPNTYVFTKAMGEMLLGYFRQNVPLLILRPAMITSTYKEPFPGWIEGARTIDGVFVGYGTGKVQCLLGDPETIFDVIPGDMVVNCMIVGMAAHANEAAVNICQVGSSAGNPVRLKHVHDYLHHYFTNNPWINSQGEAVHVGRGTVFRTMTAFNSHMQIRYLLPLKGLKLVNAILCQRFQGRVSHYERRINFVLRLVDLYRPYLFFNAIYDDTNTENLRKLVRESHAHHEANMFYFDPKSITWEDYFTNTHLPGIVKYVFK